MAPSFASMSTHVDSVPAPDQTAQESTANPAPKKKPRRAALADAKKILRASTAVTSKSLNSPSARHSFSEGGAPEFVHRPPDIARHRRKCAVCHHSEREIIEDLFIHWHSPSTIAEYYEDDGSGVNWVSIYRHAYAFGLDELRRRNLRFAFELIIEQAADIHATPAAIIASARALGTCVNPDGQWNEPERRVRVVNHIYRHDAPASSDAPACPDACLPWREGSAAASVPASSDELEESSSSFRAPYPHDVVASHSVPARPDHLDMETLEKSSSFRASDPREVLASAPADSQFVSSASAAPGEVEGCDVVGGGVGGRSFSPDNKIGDELSSYRALHPRDVVTSDPDSVEVASAPSKETEKRSEHSSSRATHSREAVDSLPASLPPCLSASSEIRNSVNPCKSKEPPISNR